MKFRFICLLLLFNVSEILAHAIWIETSSVGVIGKLQEVKVFLGEYAANERDSLNHWFSNTAESQVYIIAPDGNKTPLITTAAANYLTGNFTPSVAGVYTLTIDLPLTKVYGGMRIHYYAVATVLVNQSLTGSAHLKTATDLVVQTEVGKVNKVNVPYSVTVVNKNAGVKNANLSVQSPEGWAKTFKADEHGKVVFTPLWAGRYLLEATYTEVGSGTQEGQEYTSTWHCVTYCVEVVK